MSIVERAGKSNSVDVPVSVLNDTSKPLAEKSTLLSKSINPMPNIFTDDEYVRLLKTRTLDVIDVIDAIDGKLNQASFDYVERTISELFGFPTRDKFLKQCK